MPHPMQDIEIDGEGIVRFRKNAIVCLLLDYGKFDMNLLSLIPFSQEDREQFAQLLGYSVSGFGDLGYASPEMTHAADLVAAQLLKSKP